MSEIDGQSGLPMDALPRLPRTRRVMATDRNRNQRAITVDFVDVSSIAAAGTSLADLGTMVGIPKLVLPAGHTPDRMDAFLEHEPEKFKAYLRRDARIPPLVLRRYRRFCRDELGIAKPARTLGGLSVQAFQKTLSELGIDPNTLFGKQAVEAPRFSKATGKTSVMHELVNTFAMQIVDQAAADAYHGGRTETFMTGPICVLGETGRPRPLNDIDLRSAYPSAMAACRVPDWDAVRVLRGGDCLAEFKADVLGFAEVEFECPSGLRFPPLPVPTRRGLIFPRRGVSVATAPEIAAAVRLGVRVEVRLAIVIPWKSSVLPYLEHTARMIRLRNALKVDGKDTLESKTVKEVTNSLYGKHAQGARGRAIFDMLTGASKQMPRSSVTCPPIAAYTTGLVRGAMAEMLNSIPAGETVVSASTDGFLTTAVPPQVGLGGPCCRVLLDARRKIASLTDEAAGSDHEVLLEVKKRVDEVLAFRNRGIATTQAEEGSAPVVARAGIKFERGVDANRELVDLYLDRLPGQTVRRWDFISPRTQLQLEADLVKLPKEVALVVEPDMKRRLVNARVERVRFGHRAGAEHLATDSVPFETAAEALAERELFEAWRHGGGAPPEGAPRAVRVLKTIGDWEAWQDYLAASTARQRSGAGVRVTKGGAVASLVRQFLRALAHGAWGLSLEGRRRADVAAWLSALPLVQHACGAVTLDDFKNAARRGNPPAEGTVPVMAATLEVASTLLAKFPGFEFARLFDGGSAVQVGEDGMLSVAPARMQEGGPA